LSTEPETTAPPSGGWRSPLLLAGIGLALLIGGYHAMNYVPRTPQQAAQEEELTKLRQMAAKDAPDLHQRLKDVPPPAWRTPPYQLPGRLAFFFGLFLFVLAGIQMYRHRPAPQPESADEAPEEEEDAAFSQERSGD
jgi:hypothetical protein